MKTQTLGPEVLAVFSRLAVLGNTLKIIDQLERPLYEKVNKSLEALGGKWSRKLKAHEFPEDSFDSLTEKVENAIVTGEVTDTKKIYDFFETPPELALRVVQTAGIGKGMFVLEPSAGLGAIAECVRAMHPDSKINTMEIQEANCLVLKQKGFNASCGDFLGIKHLALFFDRIVMNPPFSGQKDIDHVLHAFTMLRPGGVLVSIMSQGVRFRGNRKTVDFRKFVGENGGTMHDLPEGSFEQSGTGVNTVIVRIPKK